MTGYRGININENTAPGTRLTESAQSNGASIGRGPLLGYFFATSDQASVDEHKAFSQRYLAARPKSDLRFESGENSRFHFGMAAGEIARENKVTLAMQGSPSLKDDPSTTLCATDILSLYASRGDSLFEVLGGRFALAVIDTDKQTVFLGVDRMGIESMAFASVPGGVVFSTSSRTVSAFKQSNPRIRSQAIFEYLFMHVIPAPGTVFEGISKLSPASMLRWRPGEANTHAYWKPTFRPGSRKSFEQLKLDLHRALNDAVTYTHPDSRTGAFLSGGLDSSTVAGKLTECFGKGQKTFSVGFGEEDYDELRYAHIANSHFGCTPFEYTVESGDIVEAFSRVVAAFDEPFGNSSSLPTYYCAKLASENGVDHLLAGDGGDELFGGNERYVRQTIFDYYQRIPSVVRRLVLEPMSKRISPDSRLKPLRKFQSYVDQARIPLPDRFESWNLVFREGVSKVLHDEFAAAVDLDGPLKLMQETWSNIEQETLLHKMLIYDWKFTLADNDIRKVSMMCDLAGVQVSYPMLHDSVVDVALQVPDSMKIRNLRLRSFYKRSMSGYLPEAVLTKQKHGFGLPFGDWLKEDRNLSDLIYSRLANLKKRQIVSTEFIDQVINEHRTGHPNYYGYVIWDLAVLEEWLSQNT